MIARFGRWGTRLFELARGIDESAVVPSRPRKSWSSENTFATDITAEEVAAWLVTESEKLFVAMSARSMKGRTITVKLRTPDFTTVTRRRTLPAFIASHEELAAVGIELLARFEFSATSRFRLAGIGVSTFEHEEEEEKEESLPLLEGTQQP